MKQVFLSFIICLSLFSCKKRDSLHTGSPSPCNEYEDSASISNKILGSWKLTSSSCWNDAASPADKNIQVSFVSNGTFILQQNLSVIAQGNWKLKSIISNQWILDLTAPSNYLSGYILFCDKRVSFADGYRDGCNNFFDKID